jgi:alpha-L-fucosidase
VDNTSRGGNYQLNVGPTDEGIFQPAAIRRLREIGAWMSVNGEAIHGTRPAKWPEPKWGRLTSGNSGQRLNAFVYDPKPGAALTLEGPDSPPKRAFLIETHESIAVTSADGGFSFTLPANLPDPNMAVIAFEW